MFTQLLKTKYLVPIATLLLLIATPQLVSAGIGSTIEGFFWNILVGIGGLFAWLGGMLLDFAIGSLVIGMGQLLTTNVGIAVDQLWVIVRDVFNILFIFALVYIGIQTILGSNESGTRKLLGNLIIAALLINFSLLITKTIVDFANIAAFQIYEQITIDADYGILEFADLQGKSISGAVMDVMQLGTFDNGSMLKQVSDKADFISAQVIIYSFLMMILMIIIGLIFATAALILVKRFVMLIIFMIFSPFMFLGLILPNFKSYQDKWWGEFFKHAFIAPAFLFMMYLSLSVLRAMQPTGSFAEAYQAEASTNSGFGIFLFFFVAAGFMIASLMVAQRMGSSAAGATIGFSKKIAGAATAGLAARTGRNTFGYGAQRLADSAWMKRWASKSLIGKGAFKASSTVADSSFDARRVGGIGKKLDIGEGRKGGFRSVLEEKEKEELNFAKSLGTLNDGQIAKATQTETDGVEKAKSALTLANDKRNSATETDRNKIKTLSEEFKTADADRKKEINNEIKTLKSSIQTVETSFADDIKEKSTALKTATESLDEAKIKAKYSNQINYMETLNKTANRWKIGGRIGGAAAGIPGVIPTIATLSPTVITTAGTGLGAAVISSEAVAYSNKKAADALEAAYGKDGSKFEKKKKQKDNADLIAEILKDSGSIKDEAA